MKLSELLLALVAGSAACHPALAQEAPLLAGAPDCGFAPVQPAPMGAPAWKGGCKAGFADGDGVLAWRDATGKAYRLEATLAAGQVVGDAKLDLPDGGVYIGTFRNGLPDGFGYFRTADGPRYEGGMRLGERNGTGEATYPNGDRYQGEWKDGKREGSGVLHYMVGGRYEGGWKNDQPSGKGKMVFAGLPGRELAVTDGVVPGQPAEPIDKASYALKTDRLHTQFRDDLITNIPVPPSLPYDKLSADEQASVKGRFPALAPGDEPPYPLEGPEEFLRKAARVGQVWQQYGRIAAYVLVGTDGKPVSVTVIGLKNADARKAMSVAAGKLKYKPAVCGGQPCQMMYPYVMHFTTRH
jgi:hypothetical protein